ncbi:MAG: histidine kinase [Bacteroidetes bacterium]|nr:histidine kinase [Bacteroidota bacterium]
MKNVLWIVSFLMGVSAFGKSAIPTTIELKTDKDFFVYQSNISIYEDSNASVSFESVLKKSDSLFSNGTKRNFFLEHPASTYWLLFKVKNSTRNKSFRIELYDFDTDDVCCFVSVNSTAFESECNGFARPFEERNVQHKNPGFNLNLQQGDSAVVYLKIKSSRNNLLKPVIRTSQNFMEYSLKEYLLLGVFYGLMLLILIYNLIYFLLLKNRHYLYYILFGFSLLLFLVASNGMGFQFLWPSYPMFNPYIDGASLSLSVVFLFLFCNSFLQLKLRHKLLNKILRVFIPLTLALFVAQLFVDQTLIFYSIDFVLFQLCFVLGLIACKGQYNKNRWFLLSFVVFNASAFISFGEKYGWIVSNVFTVYSLNIGIVVQFIFLSIGIAESIRDSYQEKNEVLTELLTTRKANATLRISELKQQMNPHFIFNALNSIQSKIIQDKKEEASKFLVLFSKLIRQNLENSDRDFVVLSDELQNLKMYLELEQMRLGSSFSYAISMVGAVDTESIKVPTFVLQPLIENAIWHGLMPLSTEKKLELKLAINERNLIICINDNGIGRKKSLELKRNTKHQSKGLQLLNERLTLLSNQLGKIFSIEFVEIPQAVGTQVLLTFEI